MVTRLGTFLAVVVIGTMRVDGQVVLNELAADNQSIVANGDTHPDYIELYNRGLEPVDLSGMSLSDDRAEPRQYVFPSGVTIGAGEYLVVWADTDLDADGLHAGFALNNRGEEVTLYAVDGVTVVDRLRFGLQATDLTVGRVPDGTGNWRLTQGMPGEANAGQELGSRESLWLNEWLASNSNGEDWLEVYNEDELPVALGGLVLSDDLQNPPNRAIPALSFIGGEGFVRFFADDLDSTAANHLDFKLSGSNGETLTLFGENRADIIDRVVFGPQTQDVSQGRLPDGGESIVFFPVGRDTPGASNFLPINEVVINEVLAHSDPPLEDAIELHNPTGQAVDISHWWLSDSRKNAQKYQIPAGTTIPAGGYIVFYEVQYNASGTGQAPDFSLNSARGDDVYLSTADASGNLTGYREGVKFGPSLNGVSFGLVPTSEGHDFVALEARTFGVDNPGSVTEFRTGEGAPNVGPRIGPIVFGELMYHPPEIMVGVDEVDNVTDEFIELVNISAQTVTLFDQAHTGNTWRLRDGVSFDFPGNVALSPGARLLVVSFDPVLEPEKLETFRSKYAVPAGVNIFGPYDGKLDNGGEDLELLRPDAPQGPDSPEPGFVPYVVVERVDYDDEAPWPLSADGDGDSLQRKPLTGYGNDPVNWVAASPTAGHSDSSSSDRDGDQMPNTWEQAYGLDPDFAGDALEDPDGDGATNLDEYRASTDPRSAESVFALVEASVDEQGFQGKFMSRPRRTYVVEYTTDLVDGEWRVLEELFAGASLELSFTDPAAAVPGSGGRFYRVRLQ